MQTMLLRYSIMPQAWQPSRAVDKPEHYLHSACHKDKLPTEGDLTGSGEQIWQVWGCEGGQNRSQPLQWRIQGLWLRGDGR